MVAVPEPEPVRLCFVCLGNICRSPTAEGVMGELVAESGLSHRIEVDSAGTGAWHVGQPADRRAAGEARRRGIVLTGTARQFHPGDFHRYDLILAMDRRNLADLQDIAPEAVLRDRVRLLRSFDPAMAVSGLVLEGTAGAAGGAGAAVGFADLDVPDPYYGEGDGFRRVFDLVERACRGLLDHVRVTYLSLPPAADG
jgi:protein-tyrosine phosphatase